MTDPFAEQLSLGIDMFNRGDFYDCHDTIEDIWLQESSDQQPFLQGLIQAAVAFHHFQHGKRGAARQMLRLSLDKLSGYPGWHQALDIASLRQALQDWEKAIDASISQNLKRPIDLPYPTIHRQQSRS